MKLEKFSYPQILEELNPYSAPKRSESASFLIWYFVNIYRLDLLEATDAVCDQKGDKGVDGIYVNEGNGSIDIFQCRLFQSSKKVGDTALKEFSGTLAQFASESTVQHILDHAGDIELTRLIKRINLGPILSSFIVRGVFLTNAEIDANGLAFLKAAPNITFVGPNEIVSSYVSDKKDVVQESEATFDVSGFSKARYVVDKETHTIIAPVLASDLTALQGIADQSLFSMNVRASLGNTKVNRDIVNSIQDPVLHKLFPLFHNGVTVLAEQVEGNDDKISIKNYFVVNGCQSLNALYQNKMKLTDQLRILTKFIQVPANSPLSGLITTNSNNQNGVKARDFKSNNPIQTRLQNEFKAKFSGIYAFEIKRGEPLGSGEIISNETAGLYLIAFDLKEPWTTHRKYQVFDEKYTEVFGRPSVTASRIVLCNVVAGEIAGALLNLKNQLLAKYVLTLFFILYVIRRILETEALGLSIISNPADFVDDQASRQKFQQLVGYILDGIMIDLNLETEQLKEDFDYRGKLRDKEFLTSLANGILASYLKDIKRGKAMTLEAKWTSL